MENPQRCIGRVARLVIMERKPDLNGALVILESYSEQTDKFTVRSLLGPNSDLEEHCLRVVPDHVEYFTLQEYEENFKGAPRYQEYANVDGIEEPCLIDLSSNFRGEYSSDLTILSSCRVLGVLSTVESPGRVTTLTKNVSVECELDDIIEFEDINFASQPDCSVVVSGGSVSFRRCRFSCSINGLGIGPGCVVVLESCLFESNDGCSVLVDGAAHVTVLNCRFLGSGVGICVRSGGNVIVERCTISGPSKGIVAFNSATIHLSNSDIYSSEDYGISVRNGATAVIKHCRFTDCAGDAVAIQGREKTTVWIEDSTMMDCLNGLHTDNGKVDVEMTCCRIENCIARICIGYTTTGSVIVNDSQSINNVYSMVNLSDGSKCFLRKDGALMTKSLADRYNAYYNKTVDFDFQVGMANKYDMNPTTLGGMRLLGTVSASYKPKCHPCGSLEPTISAYKKCGDCKTRVYCSKACQIEHWEKHQPHCLEVQAKSFMFARVGITACFHCHKVERMKKPFLCCGRCHSIYYCSKDCQQAHWRVHKGDCEPLK